MRAPLWLRLEHNRQRVLKGCRRPPFCHLIISHTLLSLTETEKITSKINQLSSGVLPPNSPGLSSGKIRGRSRKSCGGSSDPTHRGPGGSPAMPCGRGLGQQRAQANPSRKSSAGFGMHHQFFNFITISTTTATNSNKQQQLISHYHHNSRELR